MAINKNSSLGLAEPYPHGPPQSWNAKSYYGRLHWICTTPINSDYILGKVVGKELPQSAGRCVEDLCRPSDLSVVLQRLERLCCHVTSSATDAGFQGNWKG